MLAAVAETGSGYPPPFMPANSLEMGGYQDGLLGRPVADWCGEFIDYRRGYKAGLRRHKRSVWESIHRALGIDDALMGEPEDVEWCPAYRNGYEFAQCYLYAWGA